MQQKSRNDHSLPDILFRSEPEKHGSLTIEKMQRNNVNKTQYNLNYITTHNIY